MVGIQLVITPTWFPQVPAKPRFTVFSETISVVLDMVPKSTVECRIPDNLV